MSKTFLTALVVAALTGAGCSSSNSGSGGSDTPAGVVIGPLDSHCNTATDGGLAVQSIGVCEVLDPTLVPSSTASCDVTFDTGGGSGGTDAGATDGGTASSDYGPTMYGSAGNDDDCKYFISWTATPIKENADTTFTVTALRLADMKPATCAGVRPDVSLSLTHGVAAPKNPSTETSPGIYQVGPIKFDAPGIWTVRFHLYEECDDGQADSPHGHAAFYVQVP
ncbi:MAG TPA: hypothetical protein VKZ18_19095 [Polyangia bacterium]|nr:hypothetical protein [Polyangia bacterium]